MEPATLKLNRLAKAEAAGFPSPNRPPEFGEI
jgi:hypothetical protein